MRKSIIVWAAGVLITLSGCAAASPQNQDIKPSSVRVSGDVNVGAINRNGF